MKAGKIRENSERRLAERRFLHKMAHGPEERGEALEHFGDSDDGNFRIIGDDLDARGAHLLPAHAEEVDIETLLQSGGKPGGIHVAGGFTGGE